MHDSYALIFQETSAFSAAPREIKVKDLHFKLRQGHPGYLANNLKRRLLPVIIQSRLLSMLRVILCLCLLLGMGISVYADWEVILHEKRRHVTLESLADFYALKIEPPNGKKYILSDRYRSIRLEAGSREVFINNVKFILCFPVVSKSGRTLISAMDVTKIIEPVMRPGKIKNAGDLKTVVLDAGHGGHDSGATSIYGKEKDFTLDVVLRARKLLQEKGFIVYLTRSRDVFIPLEARVRMANRFRNGLFISVHFNKSNNPGASGIETYALAPRGVPSMDEESVRVSDLRQHPGNARDPENIALATLIHSAMLKSLRLYDRGIKRARFVVIRDITIPGVLLEGGFVNHSLDGRTMATPAYRQRMAESIVEGVLNYQRLVAGQREAKPSLVVTPPLPDATPGATPEASPTPTESPSIQESPTSETSSPPEKKSEDSSQTSKEVTSQDVQSKKE